MQIDFIIFIYDFIIFIYDFIIIMILLLLSYQDT